MQTPGGSKAEQLLGATAIGAHQFAGWLAQSRKAVAGFCRPHLFWIPHGLPMHAVAACAGAAMVQWLGHLPGSVWIIPGLAAVCLALSCRRTRWIATGFIAFSWTVFAAHQHLDAWLPPEQSGHDFSVSGWVDGFPSGSSVRKSFSFHVEHSGVKLPKRLRLSWYDAPTGLRPGAVMALTVRLKRPRGLVNPGGFDYEHWLLVQGYGATGYVREGHSVSAHRWRLARAWLKVRAQVAADISAAAPTRSSAALMTALVMGDRHGFDDQQWMDLQRTGTGHLVAISGMNVGLAAALVFALVRWLWLRLPNVVAVWDLEVAALAGLVGATLYSALAGFGIPVQRSLIMLAVGFAILVSRRHVRAVNGLALAVMAVLIRDPFAASSASFWLSFGAVGLLFLLACPRWVALRSQTRKERLLLSSKALIGLQTGVSFGLVPIVAPLFGRISLISPLANLVAIPWFTLILTPITLIGALGVTMGVPGSVHVLHGAGWLADLTWSGLHLMAGLPGASIGVAPPTLPVLMVALVGVIVALPSHPLPGRVWAWCALLPLMFARAVRPPFGAAVVTVLDVGHGLAAIVETRTHRLLFDTGPRSPSGFDAGQEIVLPALALAPWANLDRVIVSHNDADHSGGAASILAAFPDAVVLKGPDVSVVPGRICARGQHWRWDGVDFRILYPPPGYPPLGNNSSCVLKLTTSAGSVLFTGDIEAGAERHLLRLGGVRADVVVVPHHGSSTSSTPAFVAATGALFALVSSAYASRWNFPRPDVVARWHQEGASVKVTGVVGAMTATLNPDGIHVIGERRKHKRYWRTLSN